MADDSVLRVALIDYRLKNLNALFRNLSTPQTPNQLFAFAGEHWSDYNFYPAHVPFHNVHASSPAVRLAHTLLKIERSRSS
jgi:hypothetical protein